MRLLWVEEWSTLFAATACAVTALIVLLVAIFLSSPVVAALAIGIAVVGSILLSRDYRRQRGTAATGTDADQQADRRQRDGDTSAKELKPELFTPDVSYEEAVREVDDDEDLDLDGTG